MVCVISLCKPESSPNQKSCESAINPLPVGSQVEQTFTNFSLDDAGNLDYKKLCYVIKHKEAKEQEWKEDKNKHKDEKEDEDEEEGLQWSFCL